MYVLLVYGSMNGQDLEVDGGIKIGNHQQVPLEGTIRWTGANFEGWDGERWITFSHHFNPGLPEAIRIDSIVLLDSIKSFTVPAGMNFHMTSFSVFPDPDRPEGVSGFSYKIDNHEFNGVSIQVIIHEHHVLAAGMTLSTDNFINANGYLREKRIDYFLHDLSESEYLVPDGKTLYMSLISFEYPVYIDSVPFNYVAVAYEGQTVSVKSEGRGIFIGYLK